MSYRGSKCIDKYRDVVDIAKDLRGDIKAARTAGDLILPAHAKVSVACDHYSGGQSIHVVIKNLTPIELWDDPRPDPNYRDGRLTGTRSALRRTAEAKLTELMDAYNYNNSDPITDYYDVGFSGHVTTSTERVGA